MNATVGGGPFGWGGRSINPFEDTAEGLETAELDAFRAWPAAIASELVGPSGWRGRLRRPTIVRRENPRGTPDESGRRILRVVGSTHRDTFVGFRCLDFGTDPVQHTVLVELDVQSCGSIRVHLDAPHTGPIVATVLVSANLVGAGWHVVTATTAPIAGSHALFLVFEPERGELGDVSLFGFQRGRGIPGPRRPGQGAGRGARRARLGQLPTQRSVW